MLDFIIKENADIGLHDCRTNHIEYENHSVIFSFPAGFYIFDQQNFRKTSHGTMLCRIADNDPDGFSACIYRKNVFGKTVREDLSKKIVSAINDKRFEFEFVTVYRAYQFVLFKGYFWSDRSPYATECEIEIHTDEIIYNWDN